MVSQTRLIVARSTAPRPLGHRAFGASDNCRTRPGAGAPISAKRSALYACAVPEPRRTDTLRMVVKTRLLARGLGGGYVLGRSLLAHDCLALAAAGASR